MSRTCTLEGNRTKKDNIYNKLSGAMISTLGIRRDNQTKSALPMVVVVVVVSRRGARTLGVQNEHVI